jgi:hypothetical protein
MGPRRDSAFYILGGKRGGRDEDSIARTREAGCFRAAISTAISGQEQVRGHLLIKWAVNVPHILFLKIS